MVPRLEEKITTKVSKEVYALLQAEAMVQDSTVSEVVRRIIDQHLAYEAVRMGSRVIEDAIRLAIEPHIDRLATLITHTGISTGTAAWLGKALVNKLTRVDPDEAWNQAVARAKVGLQRSIRGIEEDFDEEY